MPDLHTNGDGHPRLTLYRLEDSKSGKCARDRDEL